MSHATSNLALFQIGKGWPSLTTLGFEVSVYTFTGDRPPIESGSSGNPCPEILPLRNSGLIGYVERVVSLQGTQTMTATRHEANN
ncbi:hypothetical protein J6590_038730 [Homalodisca vitripennis]|nr:hypothetical protein J6590_038730 [Homalodisca vitripennis]